MTIQTRVCEGGYQVNSPCVLPVTVTEAGDACSALLPFLRHSLHLAAVFPSALQCSFLIPRAIYTKKIHDCCNILLQQCSKMKENALHNTLCFPVQHGLSSVSRMTILPEIQIKVLGCALFGKIQIWIS